MNLTSRLHLETVYWRLSRYMAKDPSCHPEDSALGSLGSMYLRSFASLPQLCSGQAGGHEELLPNSSGEIITSTWYGKCWQRQEITLGAENSVAVANRR